LLETVRRTADDKERQEALGKLQDVLKRDVPAVFLYSPLYTFAHRDDIWGVDLGRLSLHSDRFLGMHSWYVKLDRVFVEGKGWLSFFGWLSSLFSKAPEVPAV
jgi:peptide/nickel transport system substrate-binding protein